MQLWIGLLLALVLTGFGVTAHHLQRTQVMSGIDEELASRVAALSEQARGSRGPGRPGPGGRPPRDSGFPPAPPPRRNDEDLGEGLGTNYRFAVWGADGEVRSASFDPLPEIPVRESRDTRVRFRQEGDWREAYHFTELRDCVLVGRSIGGEIAALRRDGVRLSLAGLGVMALGLGGGWWLTSRSLKPVEDMSRTAQRISEGSLSERIPVAEQDSELGRLAAVLNTTFERLEAAFERQRQFTADASHELRTPLTLMISEAQSVLRREREAGEYREAVEQCLGAAERMRELTTALLQLARIEDGGGAGEGFELRELVADEVAKRRDEATSRKVAIELRGGAARCRGDETRARMVVANLLGNALHHVTTGGRIALTVSTREGRVVLEVQDDGDGIARDDLPHVFERFYRADRARSRSDGRFGLGLAICKVAVEADGGTIDAVSEAGAGATFTVNWPLRP